jgi:hypothetical protein
VIKFLYSLIYFEIRRRRAEGKTATYIFLYLGNNLVMAGVIVQSSELTRKTKIGCVPKAHGLLVSVGKNSSTHGKALPGMTPGRA